jgi:predicted nucleotidyltransferase
MSLLVDTLSGLSTPMDPTRVATRFLTDVNWTIVATGDVNNDGVTDIFIRNPSTGKVVVYFLDSTGTISGYKTIFY